MKLRPLTSLIFLGTLLLPVSAGVATQAWATDSSTVQQQPRDTNRPAQGDDRPRIEEHHEGLVGAELFILGGAFVAALGIAYRVGKLSSSRKKNVSE
jgi:hypothetical protein